jgi:hypothetical protein
MPESWQTIIEAQVAASVQRHRRQPRKSTAINLAQEQYNVLLNAARSRDISMAAYLRRAALAFACFDLGLDWDQVMADEPATGGFGNTGVLQELAGSGAGAWHIIEVEE